MIGKRVSMEKLKVWFHVSARLWTTTQDLVGVLELRAIGET